MIQSPCTKLCTIDPRTQLCLGCGRTLGEVASWSTFSDAWRASVMAELPARMAEAGLSLPANVTTTATG
jgi:predicted Fe-S protein YdhL (DUF1289 family)